MFALEAFDPSSNESEPVGLFDQMVLNLEILKQDIFRLYDGKRFESDTDTFYMLIKHIKMTQQELKDPSTSIDENFFLAIGEMLLEIQESFEKLVAHQRIMQDTLKIVRDHNINVIDGEKLIRPISQQEASPIRHMILKLSGDIRKISNNPENITTKQDSNIHAFPVTSSDNQNIEPIANEVNPDKSNHITQLKSTKNRAAIIQNLAFDSSGKLLPNDIIKQKREKIKETLSGDMIPVFNWDCLAANDETFPDNELSDEMILRAIKQAKIRKDGAFIQSIKNNLIRNAANGETLDDGLETSLLLADHVKNLTESNFIQIQTVEYGKLTIISAKTIEYGDATYYRARVIFADGQIRNLLLSAGAFAVGDLSDKIAGEYDSNGKLHIENRPCTIRNIRSRIVSKELHKTGFFKNAGDTIKSGFTNLVNRFKFGKK